MIIKDQIRERLIDYLAGNLSFEQFEDWLLDQSWDMHLASPLDAQEMVLDIKEIIYQYLDRYIDEDVLKQRLYPLVASASATVIVGERPRVDVRSGSSAQVSPFRVSVPNRAAFAQ
jgi:hypothetical protein